MQTSFLFTIVKVCNKQRSYTQNPNSRRQNSHIYCLLDSSETDVKVCKEFFQNTLQVSAERIYKVLKNKRPKSTPPSESHYALHKSINRKYWAPDLNIIKLYSLYTEQVTNTMSNFVFRTIFNE